LKKYNLNIAGYNLAFESADSGLELIPSQRFLRNICNDGSSDILISVHSEHFELPAAAEKVFHAPFVKEVNGIIVEKRDNFWSIYKHRSNLYIKTIFPYSAPEKVSILKFSLTSLKWDLYIGGAGTGTKLSPAKPIETDPMEYPLDGLILYYLTVIYGDIMIHASGVNHSGYGYLFSGVSGKGKSTIAGLWDKAGAKVIHDDRLIIRNISGVFRMFNTPVYNDDSPSSSPLSRIYLIEHGTENKIIPVRGAAAVGLVMANCIQHSWNQSIIAGTIGSISILCDAVQVVKLSFRPDRSLIDFILDYE
jgi:hypothetical protein